MISALNQSGWLNLVDDDKLYFLLSLLEDHLISSESYILLHKVWLTQYVSYKLDAYKIIDNKIVFEVRAEECDIGLGPSSQCSPM